MAGMIIRPATRDDAETIARFNVLMARETEHLELDPGRVLDGVGAVFDEPGRGWYLVAESVNRVVGQLMVTYEWSALCRSVAARRGRRRRLRPTPVCGKRERPGARRL